MIASLAVTVTASGGVSRRATWLRRAREQVPHLFITRLGNSVFK
jgi:hypothetical protein